MTDIERQGKFVSILPTSQTFYHFFDTGLALSPAEWISDVFAVEISNNDKLGEAETLALPVTGYFLDYCFSDPTPGAGSAFIRADVEIGWPLAGPPTTWKKIATIGPTPNNATCTTQQIRSVIPAVPYLRFRCYNQGDATSAAFYFFWSFRTV